MSPSPGQPANVFAERAATKKRASGVHNDRVSRDRRLHPHYFPRTNRHEIEGGAT
jgi:hypothetical protein